MSYKYKPGSGFSEFIHRFEETAIAVLLGLMTMVTFINVILRYVFNDSLIWGLELTLILFAWLVVFGISYCVKVGAHLGVDAIINLLDHPGRKALAIISALCCMVYAFLLLKGAWDYYAPFINASPTEGRWFPLGLKEVRGQAWYETEQIPMPEFLRFFETWLNDGDAYEKMPRFMPYFILPFGAALLLFRFIQATIQVFDGRRESLIVSHEAEDAIEDINNKREA